MDALGLPGGNLRLNSGSTNRSKRSNASKRIDDGSKTYAKKKGKKKKLMKKKVGPNGSAHSSDMRISLGNEEDYDEEEAEESDYWYPKQVEHDDNVAGASFAGSEMIAVEPEFE